MLRLQNLSLRRGVKLLLDSASVTIHPGHRVGLVGANGCGKSSLFALLLGELTPDQGSASFPPGWIVAHVAQEVPDLDRSALDFVVDGDAELRAIETELAHPDLDGHRLAELHGRFADIGGHGAQSRAAVLLNGLGFTEPDHGRSLREFSGGWRVRLQLARALMARSDMLLLDEPTNHLDLDAVFWLEGWLRAYRGTLLVISHDREFLDNVVQSICAFESSTLRMYAGGYSTFEKTRSEVLAHQQALYERQQRTIGRLEAFVTRFRAKATKARQAQSRLKALERMEVVAQVQAASPFSFEFAEPGGFADPILTLEGVRAGYADKTVLSSVDLVVRPGARLGLLGRNGAGKSTLVRVLAGTLAALSGERRLGKDVRIGYFAQHQLEQLRADESPLSHMTRLDRAAREQDLRDYLGGFNFRGDGATAPVGPMSGGEKARLALALIVYTRPHLLLLDEPTNHLDMDMRNALTLALQSFTGAMILVSHDRSLLRATVDELWLVASGGVSPFEGDLDDYRVWLEKSVAGRVDATGSAAADGASRKDQRRVEAQNRQRLADARKPLEKRLKHIESAMKRAEDALAALETRLAAPDMYDPAKKEELKTRLREQADLRAELEAHETEWLELQTQLETVSAELEAAQ